MVFFSGLQSLAFEAFDAKTKQKWDMEKLFVSTRNRGAKSNKSNGIDGVLKENEAAQVTGNVTDNSSANTNHGNGNDEARVTVGNACHIGPK